MYEREYTSSIQKLASLDQQSNGEGSKILKASLSKSSRMNHIEMKFPTRSYVDGLIKQNLCQTDDTGLNMKNFF